MEAEGQEGLVLVQQVAPKAEDGFIFIVLLFLLLFFKANRALDDLNIDQAMGRHYDEQIPVHHETFSSFLC